eukprot:4860634-Amphidinium_carterae.1
MTRSKIGFGNHISIDSVMLRAPKRPVAPTSPSEHCSLAGGGSACLLDADTWLQIYNHIALERIPDDVGGHRDKLPEHCGTKQHAFRNSTVPPLRKANRAILQSEQKR